MTSKDKRSVIGKIKHNFEIIVLIITQWIRECFNLLFILLKPLNLILITLTISVIYYSQTQSGTNRLIFEIISAFISSITGGIITYYFLEFLGNSFLIKKSVGAIRNLQLIKYKVTNISDRINELITTASSRDFGEIDNLVQNVHKDILNSIGDWSDVNPTSEAITDFYEIVTQKETAIKVLSKEKNELEKQRNNLTQQNTGEINKLSKQIEIKDEEINKLRKQLLDFNANNIGIVSGSLISGASGSRISASGIQDATSPYSGTITPSVCQKCGEVYDTKNDFIYNAYCKKCRDDIGL